MKILKCKKVIDAPKHGKINSIMLIKAIKGSEGIVSRIARKLGRTPHTVSKLLEKQGDGWDKAREAFEIEKERLVDLAEETVRDTMRQRIDIGVASTTARWCLDRKGVHRGYGAKEKVIVEGGDKAIEVKGMVSIESLNLPLAVRREVLKAMKEAEEKAVKK